MHWSQELRSAAEAEAGVPVEVVPGVSSAVAVPALAQIPVTHRGLTTSFVVASGHDGAGPALDGLRDAPQDATLVLLMGVSRLAETAAGLIAAVESAAAGRQVEPQPLRRRA